MAAGLFRRLLRPASDGAGFSWILAFWPAIGAASVSLPRDIVLIGLVAQLVRAHA
jgi:hypothetical protein